jgi:hypothetical protein
MTSFSAGEALGITKDTRDRLSQPMHLLCAKFMLGRWISADLRNTHEMKEICAKKPIR